MNHTFNSLTADPFKPPPAFRNRSQRHNTIPIQPATPVIHGSHTDIAPSGHPIIRTPINCQQQHFTIAYYPVLQHSGNRHSFQPHALLTRNDQQYDSLANCTPQHLLYLNHNPESKQNNTLQHRNHTPHPSIPTSRHPSTPKHIPTHQNPTTKPKGIIPDGANPELKVGSYHDKPR